VLDDTIQWTRFERGEEPKGIETESGAQHHGHLLATGTKAAMVRYLVAFYKNIIISNENYERSPLKQGLSPDRAKANSLQYKYR